MATLISTESFTQYLHGQTSRPLIAPALTAADAVNGNEFLNDGRTYLWVENPTGGPITMTFPVAECSSGFTHGLTCVVPAGAKGLLGPFDIRRFNVPASGRVTVTFSGAGLNLAAVRL